MKKILLVLTAVFLLLIGCPQDEGVSNSEEVTVSSSSSSDDGSSSVSSSDTGSSDTSSSDTSSSSDSGTSSASDSSSGSIEPAIISYKIYFNNNGGKGSMSTKSLTTDETWDLTANQFTKVGYYFDSWNTQKDGSGESYADKKTVCNLVDVDDGKITLFAQWLPIHYIIEFYPNGGLGDVYTQDVSYDEVTTLTPNQFSASSAEKEFSYWTYTDAKGNIAPLYNGDEIFNLSDTSGDIIKLYAQWNNVGEYPIVYTDDKNANNSNAVSYTAADTVELIDLTDDSNRFLGWFSSSGAVDLNNKVTGWNAGEKSGSVFLWAKWCPNPTFGLSKKQTKEEYIQTEDVLDLTDLTGLLTTYNDIGKKTQRWVKYNEDSENFSCPDITAMGLGTHNIECAYNPPELQGQAISSLTFTVTINIIKARNQKNLWETTDIPSNFSLNHDFWDNANVYFVLTDRFYNGDTNNDTSYGREKGTYNTSADATKYYGGDIKGLTQKLDYLADTGINAIWITAPYEQIHGWVGGSYPYHGYWTLDWTQMDANVGTAEEFRTFVDTAHEKGIRVVMDVVMNHPGYATLVDLKNLVSSGSVGVLKKQDIENANPKTYHDVYIDYESHEWHDWWGVDWVRAGFCDHYTTGTGDLQGSCGGSLPDFITESGKGVELSPMFTRKLADTTNYPREGYKVTDLTNDSSEAGNYRMRDYIIKWLSDWVREFGIDGFRCDTAKHVEKDAWYQLKVACVQALRDWKAVNPDKKVDDSDFWMTGEVFDHDVIKDAYFTDGGFDSLINFKFKDKIKSYFSNISGVDTVYSSYANKINTDEDFNALTYISSHDTTLCYNEIIKRSSTDTTTDEANNQKTAGSLLAFCPGAIQIYYGDECGRSKSKTSDTEQQTRSQMPWDEDGYRSAALGYNFDADIHAHWSKVLNFRKNHVAVGAGTHAKIKDAPYTFSRVKETDKVIVVLGATAGEVEVDVSSVFDNGVTLHDAYSDTTAAVADGKVTFTADSNGVILIEAAE